MKVIRGKKALVTGAASGIGRGIALALAREGADVVLWDVNEVGLESVADEIRSLGVRVVAARVDLTQSAEISAAVRSLLDRWDAIDILVNNAGVAVGGRFEQVAPADFEWLFDINFWGVVHGCRAFLPQLRTKPDAHIVNLSSVFGLIGVPTQSAYCAAKFAVRGFSESLRQELAGSNIHVSCVHPGGIKTDIVKRGRHYEDAAGSEVDTAQVASEFERSARTSADDAARVILRGVLADNPRVLIGADARVIDVMARLAPRGYDAIVTRAARAAARRRKK